MPQEGEGEKPGEEKSTLEEERERLYAPKPPAPTPRTRLTAAVRSLPHAWKGARPNLTPPQVKPKHVQAATRFFIGAIVFFVIALGVAGYLLYVGGESVSVNNIKLTVEGPSTIAGGDTVPLSVAITNRNPVGIENATLEIDFPPGTRSTSDVTAAMPVYNETLGTIGSGETVTRSIKAIVFGTAGESVSVPISLTYGTGNSNSTFVKKYTYPIKISSTPLSISVDTVAETVAGKPFITTLEVRSNATVPLDNVTIEATFPFGYTLISSTVPAAGSEISLGTLKPGAAKTVTLTGTLDGQDGESRSFHFSIGTAGETGTGLAVTYMTQEKSVSITAPFLATTLALNGSPLTSATLSPGAEQDMTISYTNTLSTVVSDASISVTLSGSAVDYSSVRTTNGFYDSATHTIIFSKDRDVSLASLAPGARGVGSFSFKTVPSSSFGTAPSVTFTTSVSGTRVGQSRVPETVTASRTETVKAATAVELAAESLHTAGPFANTGPVPPEAEKATTYAVVWKVANAGSAIADATVKTTLPSYVTYTGKTAGQGSFSYDTKSRTVTWTVGDLLSGAAAEGDFQISFTPSTSQRGNQPDLTRDAAFTGYDRFAGVTITANADAVSTQTVGDPGYNAADATVQ